MLPAFLKKLLAFFQPKTEVPIRKPKIGDRVIIRPMNKVELRNFPWLVDHSRKMGVILALEEFPEENALVATVSLPPFSIRRPKEGACAFAATDEDLGPPTIENKWSFVWWGDRPEEIQFDILTVGNDN
jgi:hypothetical protein